MIIVVSFALSVWGTIHKPSATFYWTPTRAWELLLGSLLALNCFPVSGRKWLINLFGVVGLGLILYALFFFAYDISFPGVNAVYPCVGAGLLIYSCHAGNTFIARLLSLKPLVFVGLCSYSFYLWHWPVFVFAKYMSVEPLSIMSSIFLIVLSFALSVLSWKYVEQPFRQRSNNANSKKVFSWAIFASLPLLCMALVLVFTNGLPKRFVDIERLETYQTGRLKPECMDIPLSDMPEKACSFGDVSQKKSFVVWGDSHAGAMVRGIGDAAQNYNKSGILIGYSGCPPLLDVTKVRDENPSLCRDVQNIALSSIKTGDVVFLVARWNYYTHKSIINKEGPTWINDEISTDVSEQENYRVLKSSLDKTLQAIRAKGASPIVVGGVPEFFRSVPESRFLFGKDVVISRGLVDQNNKATYDQLQIVAQKNGVLFIDPTGAFCDDRKCWGSKAEDMYYSDNDHINLKGALKLSPLFDPLFQ